MSESVKQEPMERIVLSVSSRIVGPSSRRPGGPRRGSVVVRRSRIVICPDCGGERLDLGGAHAPRYVVRHGRTVRVDCIGREVSA